jgi:hypothetical protein
MLTSTTHTPGPWTLGASREILGRAFDGSARNICDTVRGGSPEAAEANARLIAAAPEMLDALKAVLKIESMDARGVRFSFDFNSPLAKQVRSAIAKAESGEG